MELGEVFPAVEAAEKAVKLDPTWAVARQTLGRAQLGFGEVELVFSLEKVCLTVTIASLLYTCLQALKSFQKALHLDPSNLEVRQTLIVILLLIVSKCVQLLTYMYCGCSVCISQIKDEDLKWAQELMTKKEAMKTELEKAEAEKREDILKKLGSN